MEIPAADEVWTMKRDIREQERVARVVGVQRQLEQLIKAISLARNYLVEDFIYRENVAALRAKGYRVTGGGRTLFSDSQDFRVRWDQKRIFGIWFKRRELRH